MCVICYPSGGFQYWLQSPVAPKVLEVGMAMVPATGHGPSMFQVIFGVESPKLFGQYGAYVYYLTVNSNRRQDIQNNRQLESLFNILFRISRKQTSKLRITGLNV